MRSHFEIARKRCNSNDGNSACEAVVGELRATLLRRGGGVARVRIPRHARGRICQNVDSFSHNRLSSPFFTQWVCTLAAAPSQTLAAPPPIGELRHARVRHAGDTPLEGFAWRKTPIATNLKCAVSPPRPVRGRLARKISPNTAPPVAFLRKSSPGTHKKAEFGPI